MNFFPNDSVVLETFLGTKTTAASTRDSENYWKLVGQRGLVVKVESQSGLPRHERGERALVKFDVDVASLGLRCHNEIPNTLWMFISDLRRVSCATGGVERWYS